MSDASPIHNLPVALTIAGSDSGGGAGIQADIKTFAALGVFGCSAITAVTAQNTRGVHGIWPVTPDAVEAQIRSVLNDLPVQSIKTGMLYQPAVVEAILAALADFAPLPLVVDPVLVASSGDALSAPDASLARDESYWRLLRTAHLITPNLDEAARLLESEPANSEADMARQARRLIDAGLSAVLVKGGHLADDNVDILLWRDGGSVREQRFRAQRIITSNTHGTGCTLSAAIAAELAKGKDLIQAVTLAKQYLTQAIEQAKSMRLGQGTGPVHHFFHLQKYH